MEEMSMDGCQASFSNKRSSGPAFAMALILLFIFLCVVISAKGQQNNTRFQPVAPEVLSNSFIRCFYKDSKGYMWIGTEDALIRFDGNSAYRYVHDPNVKTTVPHSSINTILEGKDKKLWIGTAQGLCIYNPELDNFINVDSIKGNRNYLNNRYITDLEFDNRGRLWIGTHEGGINIYDPVKQEFAYIIDPPQGGALPASNFINILQSIGDTMWCASKGGLALYSTSDNARVPLKNLDRFSNLQISAIISDRSGDVLIGTVTGEISRVKRNERGYIIQRILSGRELGESSNRILTLSVDDKGNILVGGENSGFNSIDAETGKVHRWLGDEDSSKSLPTNSIQSIYVDDLGLVWIGTFDSGVFLQDNAGSRFVTTESASGSFPFQNIEARSFAEDADGNIWIALYGVGVAKLDPKTSRYRNVEEINRKINNKNVTSVICDHKGDLWLGTAGEGVYRINPKTHQIENYPLTSDGFGNNQAFCLYQDRSRTVWAGTWGSGLFYYDQTSNQFITATEYGQPNHIPNTAYVSDMLEDSQGTFWVGTLYGLYELKKTTEKSFTYRNHLPDSESGKILGAQVQALAEDEDMNLWVGTSEGLNVKKKDSSEFTAYELGKGAHVNQIRSILTDKKSNVWMGGSNGLLKFDVRTQSFINYTREDGLKSNNFHRRASLASSRGKFFFGSNKGFDSFFPDSIRATSTQGSIILSDLKINNQSVRPGVGNSPLKKHISLTSDLELSYDQRSFTIDFVALDHTLSADYTYCYKLEGFDEEWNCVGSSHSATYTNIDPGDYTFLVKAANRDGVWISEPLRLSIVIQQVFWKTWWALSLYSLILVLLTYTLIKIRLERLKLKNEIMFEKLTREHEQRHSESKTQFFTNVAHEFRTPLSLILIPLESLMGTNEVPSGLRKRIYTAYMNASRMKRLVNELLDFNKLEAGNIKLNVHHGELVQFIMETSSAFNEMAVKRRIAYSVSTDEPLIMGWFDRDKLERMIFNLLSNAFKFTADGGQISLRMSTSHSVIADGTLCRCMKLVIEDNGIGISPEELPRIFEKFYQAKSSNKISSPGTGIGLSLTKTLVELHQGSIIAESVPDHATVFTVLLPIDAIAYEVEEDITTPAEVIDMKNGKGDFIMPSDHEQGDVSHDTDRPRILVVEDNFELRDYLVAELQSEFSVIDAKDGAEGLALVLEHNPDLIISDVMMPVKNGIEFCHAIKSDLSTSHIPFILLTAKGTTEDQINGIQTGADLYVSKPFNIRYLIAHVRQIIDSRRKLYARFSQDVYLMPGKATTNALDQEFLEKAIDYVIRNLQDPQLSVDSIASLFNLSRMQVYRKIKALSGKSVVEFIRMVRMKQAIKLMDSHKLTLSEIAFEVGFNSASYFTRTFKEEFGKTPSEYLEQK